MLISDDGWSGPYDSLFISPHPDDVAFSCPGTLLSHTGTGRRTLVVTVFSQALGGPQRQVEDAAFARAAGCDVLPLGLLDAPLRDMRLRSFEAIFFTDLQSQEHALAELTVALERVINRAGAGQIHGPLGVGRHVDHRLCHEALRAVGGDTLFYEDRPYGFVDHAVTFRLAELGAAERVSDAEGFSAFTNSFLAQPYVQAFLPEGPERARCLAHFRDLWHATPDVRVRARPDVRLWATHDTPDVPSVLTAYSSQLRLFLGSPEHYLDVARASVSERGGQPGDYGETLWRLT